MVLAWQENSEASDSQDVKLEAVKAERGDLGVI